MPFEMIKLVIWDLDDTFWRGVLAENDKVEIPSENINIVRELARRGIVSSICSKNDFSKAQKVLESYGVWDLFVFSHIDFTPKGETVRDIINKMQMRAPNVLFVDDNASNLAEVEYYNPEIQALHADRIGEILDKPEAKGSPDPDLKRLKQYQILQKKHEAKTIASSNEDFLRNSQIRVRLLPSELSDAERIHEMIMRTNQLNFTKKRISLDEVCGLIQDSNVQSGCVEASDRFGDYGVIGWYALLNGELMHFLFSCRIINLGIEQFVYAYLGYPEITVSGDTASSLSKTEPMPQYITLEAYPTESITSICNEWNRIPDDDKLQVYILGACDLFYAVGHMALPLVNLRYECNTFYGDERGVNVGTEYIRSCFTLSGEEKDFCRRHFYNYRGPCAFNPQIFEKEYDYVVLSFHDDMILDIYQSKRNPEMFITRTNDSIRSKNTVIPPDGCDAQDWLNEEFSFLGRISPERFRDNLLWIYNKLSPKTYMLLMTGPEFDYYRDSRPKDPDSHNQILLLNKVMRDFCAEHERAGIVEINELINKREHFKDYIFHLVPERSYMLALHILKLMASHETGSAENIRKLFRIGERKVALWSDKMSALTNYYSLCALGLRPHKFIIASHERGYVDGVLSEASHVLYQKQNEWYVLAFVHDDFKYMRKTLSFYGFSPERDYFGLVPAKFNLDWREEQK